MRVSQVSGITTITAALFFCFACATQATADPAETEIEQLLEFVAQSGCEFERNGSSHNSVDAADHLRLKYRRGKRYVASAEEFIDRLATESSWTGRPYTVRCSGQQQLSATWLHEALEQQRSSRSGAAQN